MVDDGIIGNGRSDHWAPKIVVAVLGAVCLLAASPTDAEPSPADRGASASHRTLDDLFAEVNARVPGFGGVYVDEDRGVLNVLTVGRGRPEEAQRALVEVLGDASLGALEPVALPARYSFGELKTWFDQSAHEVLALDGVTSADIDEVENRLAFGVADVSREEGVRAVLEEHGIPTEAVVVRQVPPEPVQVSLRDAHRPVVGGLQISFKRDLNEPICSLGFNVTRSGVRSFVTNSHCSAVRGSNEGTVYYQPLSPTSIGGEWHDPAHFTGTPCPSGRRCRYSDSLVATFGDLTASSTGIIASPPLDSYLWNGTDVYRVTSEEAPVVGNTVNKVGRTTGRTRGSISETCVSIAVADTDITLLCQSRAGYVSNSGDSGSPVFRITNSPSANDVALVGIHWGGNGAFSPIGGIQRTSELGAVQTCAAGFSC